MAPRQIRRESKYIAHPDCGEVLENGHDVIEEHTDLPLQRQIVIAAHTYLPAKGQLVIVRVRAPFEALFATAAPAAL